MGSSHASQVGRNRAAQYHRTMNPAPLRLRKAPERVWRLRKAPPEQVCAHLLTVARPTAPVIARDCCQDCCQRGSRFWTPSDGHRTAPQVNAELGQQWTARPVLRTRGSCPPRARSGGPSGTVTVTRGQTDRPADRGSSTWR